MVRIRRLVLDVLKPHDPSLLALTQAVCSEDSVDTVNSTVYEIDQDVENIKMTVQGENVDFDAVRAVIDDYAASIHSIDEAVCGETIIDASKTPQD